MALRVDGVALDILSGAGKPAHSEGVAFYDGDEHAFAIYNDEADVTHQVGQEGYIRVYNNSGALIPNGKPVYVSGTEVVEYRPTIGLAQSNSKSTSEVIGFSTHDIENNTFGYVTAWGLINDLDTSAFTSGDPLYLREDVAGGLRTSPPPEGNFEVLLGYVIRSDVLAGRVLASITANLGLPAGDAQELVSLVRKGSPGTINPGEVVYITGWNSGANLPEVELADSSGAATMPAFGIARDPITNTTEGRIVVSGKLTNLDTSAFSVGDGLYVSETTGELTSTKPTGTALIQRIAQVLRSHSSLGVIQIFGAGRANDLPNIPTDYIWVGDSNSVPQAVPNVSSSYRRDINPAALSTVGNAAKVITNDYAAIELKEGSTAAGVWSDRWRRTPTTSVKVKVQFKLREAGGTGTIVRLLVRYKARATGESTAGAFDEEVVKAVTVVPAAFNNVYEGVVDLTSSNFAEGDAVAMHVGRDGNNDVVSGEAADNYTKKAQIISIELETV